MIFLWLTKHKPKMIESSGDKTGAKRERENITWDETTLNIIVKLLLLLWNYFFFSTTAIEWIGLDVVIPFYDNHFHGNFGSRIGIWWTEDLKHKILTINSMIWITTLLHLWKIVVKSSDKSAWFMLVVDSLFFS